ncbi:opsin-3 [Scyliorhinus canicula]|uniref:opsin-3 n=1 Tax=Scyliorhinus canicula TaxID=7830 RepID=UPI0018F52764|nr:opsin-3 [Scyliorhinus canicula]
MNPANGTDPQEESLFCPSTYKVLAAVVGTVGALGFCNNLLMLVLYCKFKRLKTPTNLLLVNISIGDLLLSVFGLLFTFLSSLKGRWVWGSAACVWDGFTNSLFGISSIMSLTALAYERYLRVVSATAIGFSWAWRVITYIWLYSLAWTGAPLVGWNRYTLEQHKLGCSVNWDPRYPSDTSFIILLFLCCLFIPVSIIAYCYGNILCTLRMLQNIQDLRSVRLAKILINEKNVTTMCFFMIFIFLICWVPYAVVSLMLVYGYADTVTPTISIILSLLAKSSTAYNNVICICMNEKYRWCLMQLFCSRLMRIKWIIKDHAVEAQSGEPIVLSKNIVVRPKKKVTFNSSSIMFIITSDEAQDIDSTAELDATNLNIIQVRPLNSETAKREF